MKKRPLFLLPLRDIIVFPRMIVPLFIGRMKSIKAIEQAMVHEKTIMLTTQTDAKANDPTDKELCEVGTIAEILQILKLADGTLKILVEGKSRAKIDSFLQNEELFEVEALPLTKEVDVTQKVETLMRSLVSLFEKYARLHPKVPNDVINSRLSINDPDHFTDTIAAYLVIKSTEKQRLLELANPLQRMDEIYKILETEIEVLQIEKKVRGRVKKQVEKNQKEYYLNEQMKAIQKELGQSDDFKNEIDELSKSITKAKMPKEANDKAVKELKKLQMMSPMSAEATVVRNYIDWMIALPWNIKTSDKLNLDTAEDILDKEHYGLSKVKERILEHLAVRKLVKKMKGPILCLVGPPGVGKTSLGQSIAKAMGRKFVRMSLGGVRDEAEIRGHRKTYIGAMPGRIIQYLKKAGSRNPVFMLDEVDKMSTDFRGDPSSALLEVLDPEQNFAFNDHYLEVDFDLSEIMFITTANVLHTIPMPLLDRMEVLRIPGYTDIEKVKIANMFLAPKKVKEHGLTPNNLKFSEPTIKKVIRSYTKEAGVRNLEREIANICRKVARNVAKHGKDLSTSLTPKSISKYLGTPRYKTKKVKDEHEIGIATGLAWTEVGGEILTTEVTVMDGAGKLTLTGKLGDVMQESAQAALSYVRSRSKELGLEKNFYKKIDIHIHVPEGAIPKDGPSAGITMATVLISALTNSPVKKDVAMTGEITLRGKVLPIGGLKEKLLAAHRSGMTTVIIPKDNEKDLTDIPAVVRKALTVVPVESMDEVINIALIFNENNSFTKNLQKTFLAKKDTKKAYTEISPLGTLH